MALGWPGNAVTFTESEEVLLDPQLLLASTVTEPLEDPTVALIELEVEVPDQPEGSAQV